MAELDTLRYFRKEGLREELERAERRERARSLTLFRETNVEPSTRWLSHFFASRGCA